MACVRFGIAVYLPLMTRKRCPAAPIFRRWLVATAFLAVTWSTLAFAAQDSQYPPRKPNPPKIESQILVMPESVVREQWTHTLPLVNVPQFVGLMNPGGCVRVGIYATGDNRDSYLKKARLSFTVDFEKHRDFYPYAPLSRFKQIKPEGEDFVAGALHAGGVELPAAARTMASLGASTGRWCAPASAGDGTAVVEAEVETSDGRRRLEPALIEVESFEAGSKRPFKDEENVQMFVEAYYRQPEPARLLPLLQFVIAEENEHPRNGLAEITAAFVSAALKSEPIAAQDFLGRIRQQPPMTRAFGLLALRSAGYDISGVLSSLSEEQQQKFRSLSPLQDPFDLTPTESLFNHLDMLWAVFSAMGQFRPVQTISTALSWRADYEAFERLRDTPNHSQSVTPSLVRGVVYSAAGWSLASYQRNDPLVADYIDFLRASPDTRPVVKSELAGLAANPAFKHGPER